MTTAIDPSRISTNYYKLAHLSEISYTIFGPAGGTPGSGAGGAAAGTPGSSGAAVVSDQSLLELELAIRHSKPDILLTYYNKCLYYFEFGHLAHRHASAQLQAEYPGLELKFSSTAKVDVLANPPKSAPGGSAAGGGGASGAAAAAAGAAGGSAPPGSHGAEDELQRNLYLPFVSLTFLKAVKKLLLYRLSRSNSLRMFGNYSTVAPQGVSGAAGPHDARSFLRYIVHIDPLLLPNGDLLVCITQRNNISLFDSRILETRGPEAHFHDTVDAAGGSPSSPVPPVDSAALQSNSYAIYIIPSGIRCHLYHSEDPTHSFTYTPPKNSDAIINLIKLSTGLDLASPSPATAAETDNANDGGSQPPSRPILWVKLIPNLQHLNNQTSRISKFIHSVDNRKFILWPWELCLIQFGHRAKSGPHLGGGESVAAVDLTLGAASSSSAAAAAAAAAASAASISASGSLSAATPAGQGLSDPFSLISEFMDFGISQHSVYQPAHAHIRSTEPQPAAFSVPSVGSIGSQQQQQQSQQQSQQSQQQSHAPEPPLVESGKDGEDPINIDADFPAGGSISDQQSQQQPQQQSDQAVSAPPAAEDDESEMDDLFGEGDSDDEEEQKKEEEEVVAPEAKTEQPTESKPEEEEELDITKDFTIIEREDLEGYEKGESGGLESVAEEKTEDDEKPGESASPKVKSEAADAADGADSDIGGTEKTANADKPEKEEPVDPKEASVGSNSRLSSTSASGSGSGSGSHKNSIALATSTYLDIPKDQMTINPIKSFTKPLKTPYNDPGAPPALMPTPFIPPSSTFAPSSVFPASDTEDTSNKSIFSPLHFNPIIKSNIDTKYGRGGKFYVEKDSKAAGDDPKRRSLRATSVIGYEREDSVGAPASGGTVGSGSGGIGGNGSGSEFPNPKIELLEGDVRASSHKIRHNHGVSGSDFEDGDDDDDDSMKDEIESDEDEENEVTSMKVGNSPPLKLNTIPESFAGGNYGVQKNWTGTSRPTGGANQVNAYNNAYYGNAGDYSSPTSNYFALPNLSTNLPKLDSPFGNVNALGITAPSAFSSRGNHITSMSPVDLPDTSFSRDFIDEARVESDDVVVVFEKDNDDVVMKVDSEDDVEIIGESHVSGLKSKDSDPSGSEEPGNAAAAPMTDANFSQSGAIVQAGTPGGMSEANNCLPLILRCINVCTIPDIFILNNLAAPPPSTNFMYVDEDDHEWGEDEFKSDHKMVVKLANLDDFLYWLTPSLIFDMGMNTEKFDQQLELSLPAPLVEQEDSLPIVDGQSVGFEKDFESIFPLAYRVSLSEFVCDLKGNDKDMKDQIENDKQNQKSNEIDNDNMELENQLSFLDDITNDIMLNPTAKVRRLKTLDWDSIYSHDLGNIENSSEYRSIMTSTLSKKNPLGGDFDEDFDDISQDYHDNLFLLPPTKAKVHKQSKSTIVNMNSIGLQFWPYLKLNPLNGPKDFQMVMITEVTDTYLDCNGQFISSLVYNYRECQFGNINQLNLPTDGRPELEGAFNGMIQIHHDSQVHGYEDFYRQVNKKLSSLAESIKLDLINKTNRFEFDRPLLLLFINFDDSMNSLVKISKLCRNFQKSLHQHQVPLVEVFNYVIPWSKIYKRGNGFQSKRLKYMSNVALSKISMSLYNQCPDINRHPQIHPSVKLRSSYAQLVKELPTKIDFRMLTGGKDGAGAGGGSFNGEIFLHLACERSIDRNWFVAAWSDPLGQVTYTKSWFCSPSFKSAGSASGSGNNGVGSGSSGIGGGVGGSHDLSKICDEIWEISIELFKKLNQNIIREMSGFGGRRFLVLTRINSIIPDEELIHWKRLSVKNKDISLVVLSVNKEPKLLFHREIPDDGNPLQDLDQSGTVGLNVPPIVDIDSGFPESNNSSPNGVGGLVISASPFNGTGLSFHSPQQFGNSSNNFLSPQDFISSGGGGGGNSNSAATAGTPSSNNANSESGKITTSNSKTPNNALKGIPGGPSGHKNSLSHGTPGLSAVVNKNALVLSDPRDTIHAVIPRIALPSFNSPSRSGMKIGYLMKELNRTDLLVYEVNLLSCSNYWNLNSIMQIILKQYKNLITLNDILGVREKNTSSSAASGDYAEEEALDYSIQGLIPWHIAAVSKTLDYLVHIEVED